MANAPAVPDRVGPYRPIALLGQGGMGVVYRAEHELRPGQFVALKVIRESPELNTEDARRRFQRETALLEGLRHPNIVSILDVGLDGLCQYFAMELLEGYPLSSYIGSPYQKIAPLLIQVCEGLRYLASRSIVHRDLSPGNILIVQQDDVPVAKILDFGIAKDVEAKDTLHDFTRTGLIMGKPSYWSPEQLGSLGSSKLIDWRSDVYSLGVIFYQLFSGQLPFQCKTPYQYALAHLTQAPPALEAAPTCPPLPEALTAVVNRMLSKGREDRPNYSEIIEVLAQLLEQIGSVAAPLTRPTEIVAVKPLTITAEDAPHRTVVGRISKSPVPITSLGRRLSVGKALGATFTAIIIVGVVAFFLSRRRPADVPPVSLPITGALTQGSPSETSSVGRTSVIGFLNIDSMPWARVEAIVDESTGRTIPVSPDLATPVSLEMPPGRYRISLVSGVHEQRKSVVVVVTAGRITAVNERFGELRDVLVLLD